MTNELASKLATYDMRCVNLPGGPCPSPTCGRSGELLRHHGAYAPGATRYVVHLADDGVERTCAVPLELGTLKTGLNDEGQPRWWFEPWQVGTEDVESAESAESGD